MRSSTVPVVRNLCTSTLRRWPKLGDATAKGTIENSDAMPRAWIARFGRTVAEQVLDAVQSRMSAARTPGVAVSLAGERIGGGAALEDAEAREAEAGLRSLAAWVHGFRFR